MKRNLIAGAILSLTFHLNCLASQDYLEEARLNIANAICGIDPLSRNFVVNINAEGQKRPPEFFVEMRAIEGDRTFKARFWRVGSGYARLLDIPIQESTEYLKYSYSESSKEIRGHFSGGEKIRPSKIFQIAGEVDKISYLPLLVPLRSDKNKAILFLVHFETEKTYQLRDESKNDFDLKDIEIDGDSFYSIEPLTIDPDPNFDYHRWCENAKTAL